MEFKIRTYDEKYLETQVELGNQIMKDWKFQNQSNLEHLKKVYARDDFQPDTRIYATSKDEQLLGFQTSQVLSDKESNQTVARMEFPLVKDDDWSICQALQDASEEAVKKRGADLMRVRASPHWGDTVQLAEKFGFTYEKPHLMTSRIPMAQMKIIEELRYSFIKIQREDETSIDLFREIFPKRFPMRYEGEVDSWFDYYEDRDPAVWIILLEDNQPMGHLIGFLNDKTVSFTSLFSLGDNQARKLQELLSYAYMSLTQSQISQTIKEIALSIGDDQVPYAEALNQLGLQLQNQIAYYVKEVKK